MDFSRNETFQVGDMVTVGKDGKLRKVIDVGPDGTIQKRPSISDVIIHGHAVPHRNMLGWHTCPKCFAYLLKCGDADEDGWADFACAHCGSEMKLKGTNIT